MKPIIQSPLDTDFYKFSMQYVFFEKFPNFQVEYEFRNRTKGIPLLNVAEDLHHQIEEMARLRFSASDISYLCSLGSAMRNLGYFPDEDYMDFLRNYRFRPEQVHITGGDYKTPLAITIKGGVRTAILWETPLLATISELHSMKQHLKFEESETICGMPFYNYCVGMNRLREKLKMLAEDGANWLDFGSRRRYSFKWQDELLGEVKKYNMKNFLGTSNVYFAKKYGFDPKGTMAHEYQEAMQRLTTLENSIKYGLVIWREVYHNNLGIALTDTLGIDAFLRDFNGYDLSSWNGLRHDSGSPDNWMDKVVKHYWDKSENPFSKTYVFSDGLDVYEIMRLHNKYSEYRTTFGWGTNLTNDVGITPLQIVIKMTKCKGKPVAKISDSSGKQMCNDQEYLKLLIDTFHIKRKLD
jgi:nicotinate phosphoribosyltransferase